MASGSDPYNGPEHESRSPTADAGQDIDLERVVFDPEYRAKVRLALNRCSGEASRAANDEA